MEESDYYDERFWDRDSAWPHDSAEYAFLARAIQKVEDAIYPEQLAEPPDLAADMEETEAEEIENALDCLSYFIHGLTSFLTDVTKASGSVIRRALPKAEKQLDATVICTLLAFQISGVHSRRDACSSLSAWMVA